MLIITIIGLVASLITLLAVWGIFLPCTLIGSISRKGGGIRITYISGAYTIKSGAFDGKLLYKSSDNPEDYKVYREMGKIEHYEEIAPFFKWNVKHWVDDIRTPQYPIRLL